jgi:hypothetical protein
MQARVSNPESLIRAVLIVLFLVVTFVLRARKLQGSTKPGTRAKGPQLGESLREAMRQAAEQARARKSGQTVEGELTRPSDEPFEQPPKIQPESSFIPSLLLLALAACLCLIAYRYWAG